MNPYGASSMPLLTEQQQPVNYRTRKTMDDFGINNG